MRPPLTPLRVIVCAAALSLTASVAHAQSGLNLSWDDCGSFGTAQQNFACDTNSGANVLVGSATLGFEYTTFLGETSVIDVQVDSGFAPRWWGQNSCRTVNQQLSVSFDFTGMTHCIDPFAPYPPGYALGGVGETQPPNSSQFRLKIAQAVPSYITIPAGECYFFRLNILHNKTVGTGSCTGCMSPACLVFNSIAIDGGPDNPGYNISTPILRQYVQFQAGTIGSGPNGSGCPGATAVRKPTWGTVKSLYR